MSKWISHSFNEVILDDTKSGTKIKKENYLNKGQYPVIDQGQELIAGYQNEDNGLYKDIPAIIFGDHTRIIKYIDFPFFLGADGVKILKAKNKDINYKYLYYFFLKNEVPNTGYNRHFKWLKEFNIPLPPLETQKQIAKTLDAASELLSMRKQQLAELDNLIKSVFYDMFGDPVINEKGWQIKGLKDVCLKITDGTHDTPKRVPDGVLFITGKNIRPFSIDLSNIEYITQEDHEIIYKRCNPQVGDILYTNIGVNYGTAAKCTLGFEFSMKNVALLKINRNIVDSSYIECMLNYLRSNIISQNQTGGAQSFMGLSTINNIRIPIPRLDLQSQFNNIVTKIEEQKSLVKKSIEESQLLFDSLMSQYFD